MMRWLGWNRRWIRRDWWGGDECLMSSTSFPVSADSPSGLSELEASEPSPSAKLILIAEPSSESTGQMSLFTETSANSLGSKYLELMSSAAASPVSHLAR